MAANKTNGKIAKKRLVLTSTQKGILWDYMSSPRTVADVASFIGVETILTSRIRDFLTDHFINSDSISSKASLSMRIANIKLKGPVGASKDYIVPDGKGALHIGAQRFKKEAGGHGELDPNSKWYLIPTVTDTGVSCYSLVPIDPSTNMKNQSVTTIMSFTTIRY